MRLSILARSYKQKLARNNRIKLVLKHWITLRDKLTDRLIRIDIKPEDKLVTEHRSRISRDIRNCTYHINILRNNIRETETLLNRIPLG